MSRSDAAECPPNLLPTKAMSRYEQINSQVFQRPKTTTPQTLISFLFAIELPKRLPLLLPCAPFNRQNAAQSNPRNRPVATATRELNAHRAASPAITTNPSSPAPAAVCAYTRRESCWPVVADITAAEGAAAKCLAYALRRRRRWRRSSGGASTSRKTRESRPRKQRCHAATGPSDEYRYGESEDRR